MLIQVGKSRLMGLSQKSLTVIEKLFLFRVPMNPLQCWRAKLESVYSFMLKYSKIPVCVLIVSIDELEASEIMLRDFST